MTKLNDEGGSKHITKIDNAGGAEMVESENRLGIAGLLLFM